MPGFLAILATEIAEGKYMIQSVVQKIKDNFDYLYSASQGGSTLPVNGSFEIDNDSDGEPDNWSWNAYNGTLALDTTAPSHGVQCAKITDPGGAGVGGGYLDSDYIEVSDVVTKYIKFLLKCSVAGVDVRVEVREYDKAKAYQSTQSLYSSTSNPTSWTLKEFQFTPASSIAYIKVRLIGGHTDTNQAGDIYFDNVVVADSITGDEIPFDTMDDTASPSISSTSYWYPSGGLYYLSCELMVTDGRIDLKDPDGNTWTTVANDGGGESPIAVPVLNQTARVYNGGAGAQTAEYFDRGKIGGNNGILHCW